MSISHKKWKRWTFLVGREFGALGISLIDSKTFGYGNVTEELTFHWFKHNMMCKGNPWICDGENSTSSENTKNSRNGSKLDKTSKKSRGGKKSRRKKQSGKNVSSSRDEIRRPEKWNLISVKSLYRKFKQFMLLSAYPLFVFTNQKEQNAAYIFLLNSISENTKILLAKCCSG